MVGESTEAVGAGVGGGTSGNKMPTLEEYGTNLTKLAEEVIHFATLSQFFVIHYIALLAFLCVRDVCCFYIVFLAFAG